MDEQKNNYEGPAEQPANGTTRGEPPYEQRQYVGGQFPDQRGYIHHDDYSSWPSQRYPSAGPGMTPGTPGSYQKKPSCRWPVFRGFVNGIPDFSGNRRHRLRIVWVCS